MLDRGVMLVVLGLERKGFGPIRGMEVRREKK